MSLHQPRSRSFGGQNLGRTGKKGGRSKTDRVTLPTCLCACGTGSVRFEASGAVGNVLTEFG